MSVLIDDYGRPIILFDAEDTKKRIKGVEAYKVYNNIILVKYNGCKRSSINFKNFFRT